MIIQRDFLNKLKDFGLNTYEAKIWAALLSRGMSTAGELSDIANVPRSRSYDVLESLERKGFVILRVGKPIKYIAVAPEEVIERVKKKVNEEAVERAGLIDELKSSKIYDELNLLHKQGIELVDPGDMSGSFRGRDAIYGHVDLMLKNAKESVLIMTSEEGLVRKTAKFKKQLRKLKDKGVKIKIIAPVTKKNQDALKDLKGIADVKNIQNSTRAIIIDGKEMVFMLLDDKEVHPGYDVGIWIASKLFVSTVENMVNICMK